jgi:hypothetical protein
LLSVLKRGSSAAVSTMLAALAAPAGKRRRNRDGGGVQHLADGHAYTTYLGGLGRGEAILAALARGCTRGSPAVECREM